MREIIDEFFVDAEIYALRKIFDDFKIDFKIYDVPLPQRFVFDPDAGRRSSSRKSWLKSRVPNVKIIELPFKFQKGIKIKIYGIYSVKSGHRAHAIL